MEQFEVQTKMHAELRDITELVRKAVQKSGVQRGIAHIFVPHTTAGLTINENADPDVKADLLTTLEKMVPWDQQHFRHSEGNSAAHLKASLMGFATTVPIENGAPALGMWQAVYLCEFDGPRHRQVWVQICETK